MHFITILVLYRDINGKENGNYCIVFWGYVRITAYILGSCRGDGKEHGNYYRVFWGYITISFLEQV